jgi:putative Mn2+ efflux pump MntP
MSDDFIPVIGISAILLIVFGYSALMRFISYKETMTLAEKGLTRPEPQKKSSKGYLRSGILTTALGIALSIGLYPIGFGFDELDFPFGLGPWMLVGFIPLFLGLGMILIHYLIEKE